MSGRPLAIDLFSGLGGWSIGLAAAGWDVIRFDLEDMCKLLSEPYPEHSQLVIQDVLTLHGSQFRNVDLIVSSSPCQEFSYRAMPWKRAKALGPPELGMALFHAQFRIQREASEAAGRHIPTVVENVRGAQPWIGRARWNFGSYYLWGDVPALMPSAQRRAGVKGAGMDWSKHGTPGYKAVAFNDVRHQEDDDGRKVAGFRFDGSGRSFQSAAVAQYQPDAGIKQGGTWWHDPTSASRTSGSASPRRKGASARIAKIPFALAYHIGQCWHPEPFSQ